MGGHDEPQAGLVAAAAAGPASAVEVTPTREGVPRRPPIATLEGETLTWTVDAIGEGRARKAPPLPSRIGAARVLARRPSGHPIGPDAGLLGANAPLALEGRVVPPSGATPRVAGDLS